MDGPIESFFRHDVRCLPEDLGRVASSARDRVPLIVGYTDDSDEDLVVRLRDPSTFGTFVGPLVSDETLAAETRAALAAYVFDLLPIPRDEEQAFLVSARAPAALLGIARSLGSDLTTEHMLHLVYAVYLDRSLVTNASEGDRQAVLDVILGSGERLAVLYATMHLAAVEVGEGVRTLRKIMASSDLPSSTKGLLRDSLTEGKKAWLELAQAEGLLPEDLDIDNPEVNANAPHVPESIQRAAE